MLAWDELLQEIYNGEKINMECKRAEREVPQSVYETYSSFANTTGGIIVLGVEEDKTKATLEERFIVRGVSDPEKMQNDFWNTINSQKVNKNILVDDDVYIVKNGDTSLLVIHVPKADYTMRPVYKGENPYKGTFKRNHEGDYHAKEYEVRAMFRDQLSEGYDQTIHEGYTMDDIDADTLKRYRIMFNTWNPDHVWINLPDKDFLEMMGGYRRDRKEGTEGLTTAGLLMFGTGLAVRDRFSNISMDYRDETHADDETRWIDRVTYDGTWENNLFNFLRKVMPKLTEDLKRPFVLKGMQRVDDTPMHKAIREAFVNMIIHADYMMDASVLRVIKNEEGFTFTNPGNLKISKEQIYHGGESKPRNPHMQTMLRMVGYGDYAGSGFPKILKAWSDYGLEVPELFEDTIMDQVTLRLRVKADEVDNEKATIKSDDEKPLIKIGDKKPTIKTGDKKPAIKTGDKKVPPKTQMQYDKILEFMEEGKEYRIQDFCELLGLKGSRIREILNGLSDYIDIIGNNKDRRYIKK